MKRVEIIRISKKQRGEVRLRGKMKAQLILENRNHCMTCDDENRDWRGLSLSHIIPLSRGGKTELSNLELLCYVCHGKKHGIREVGNDS